MMLLPGFGIRPFLGISRMTRARHLLTATALTLVALLITSAASLADPAVACICPGGQVKVEAATACCCKAEAADDHVTGRKPEAAHPSCSDCTTVPLREPLAKNDAPHLDTVSINLWCHASPNRPVVAHQWRRPLSPGLGHRLPKALLSAVVLLH
jgi:hypothetical protein